jgi:hypothetical protein
VGRAATATGVTVEVFVEPNQVSVVRVIAEAIVFTGKRTLAVLAAHEEFCQAMRQLIGDLLQSDPITRSCRTLHHEVVAVEPAITLKRFDQQVVDRKPDRAGV